MGAVCPNINSQDWKNLVAQYGIEGAIREFIKNGYNVPISNEIDMNPRVAFGKYVFNGRGTTQFLTNNPKVAAKVLETLLERFPHVNITYDGLFDENGQWREFKPGEKGMHMRNAFISAIAFSNEANLETIPHEFAHEYIQMYRDHPMVAKALEGKTEEELADQLGKFFAERETKSWIKKLIDDIMYLIQKTFGDVEVSDKLAREYYKGTKLGKVSPGEGYISYQEKQPEKSITRVKDAMRLPEKYITVSLEEFFITKQAMNNNYNDKIFNNYELPNGGFNFQELLDHLGLHIDAIRRGKQGAENLDDTDLNHAGIDNRLVDALEEVISQGRKPNEKNLALLHDYFKGVQKYESLPANIQQAIDTLHGIHNAIGIYDQTGQQKLVDGYQQVVSKQLITEGNTATDAETVEDAIRKEINDHLENKNRAVNKFLDMLPSFLSFMKDSKGLHKFAGWLYDGYMIPYSLTGKIDSIYQKVFYDSLDAATGRFQETQNRFKELFTVADSKGKYKMWGTADKRKGHIDDYKNIEVTDKKGKKIKLTMSEAATVFLMLEQADTNEVLRDHGFFLDEVGDKIKGRTVKGNYAIKLSPESRAEIINEFSNNPDNVALIEAVRNTMDYLHSRTNPSYKTLTGMDMDKREKFFPVYYGPTPLDQRTQKNTLEQWKSNKARLGGTSPLRIGDVKKVMNNFGVSASMYGAYSVPIRNNKKVLNAIRQEFRDKRVNSRLDSIETILKKLEDPGLLYSGQGEKQRNQIINELMSNFTIYTLGYNKFVVLKQTASYMAAKQYIDTKYLRESGMGIGGFIVPKLKPFFQSLKKVNSEEELDIVRKLLRIEHRLDESNPVYAEMIKYSERLKFRMSGHVTRETSEAIYDMSRGKDKFEVKIFGKKMMVSKVQAMEGIRVMDAITIMGIWNAVKLETEEGIRNGKYDFTVGSEQFFEHVATRTEFVVNRTQPTSDIINRSELSTEKGNVARGITMFSSATQKMGQLMIMAAMEFNNNPTKENFQKLGRTFMNVGLMTTFYVTMIDMVKSVLMGYMDDDEPDEYIKFTKYNMINNMAGYFHVIGTITRLASSRMDDQPWTASVQHPIEALMDDTGDAIANTLSFKWGKAFEDWLKIGMQTKGIPGFPLKTPLTLYGNYK